MKHVLTNEEIRSTAKKYDLTLAFPCDSLHTSELFARAIEAKILEKIGANGAAAVLGPDYDGKVTPLYTIPFICTERSEVEAQPRGEE